MRIYSELTNKEYKTVAECLAAEKGYKEAEKKRKEEEAAKKAAKSARQAELRKVYKDFETKLTEYCNDYMKDTVNTCWFDIDSVLEGLLGLFGDIK